MALAQQEASALLRDPDLKVVDVMRTDFRSCNAGTPMTEVVMALRQSRMRILPVTEAQVPVGIVTETAVMTALAAQPATCDGLTARDLMTGHPTMISSDRPLSEALRMLPDAGGRLLVLSPERRLDGILTLAELAPQLSEIGLSQLVTRMLGEPGGNLDDMVPPPSPPVAAARETDPTEIHSKKSQAQPHAWDSPTGAHPEPVPLLTASDLINPLLHVSDAMTPSPRTCSPASTALEAVLIFRDADCGVIPVTDGGKPVGVVTDREIALALADHEFDLARTPLSDLMTGDPITIASDATLEAAIDSLGTHGIRRLLAVDDSGLLVGILSWPDLVPLLSDRGLGLAVSRIIEQR